MIRISKCMSYSHIDDTLVVVKQEESHMAEEIRAEEEAIEW